MERFNLVDRTNADYIDRLYEQYQHDPRTLDETWQAFFSGFESAGGRNGSAATKTAPSTPLDGPIPLSLGIHNLVHTYRELGHSVAKLDPLGHDRPNHPLLDLSQFNITEADLDRKVGKADFYGATDGT